jgi:hypothetical protein
MPELAQRAVPRVYGVRKQRLLRPAGDGPDRRSARSAHWS